MQHLMPAAHDVPAEPHHQVPVQVRDDGASPAAADAAAGALVCPHTGTPCPALVRLFGSRPVSGATAQDWARKLAPCSSCRVEFEARRSALRGLRLGQREREVLLGAAHCETFIVTEAGMSRSLSAARRRAAQSLGKAGLVATPTENTSGGSKEAAQDPRQTRAAVALTPLGRYVMAAFGRYIEGGKPVRWTRPAAGVVAPGKDPSQLLDETVARTQAALKETLTDLKRALVAALRPVRDPGALDAITRHLERKVQGLKELLEARP